MRRNVGLRRRTQMKFSYVGPGDYNGEKGRVHRQRLGEIEPMAYRFMLNFAQDNDLQIVDGVCMPRQPQEIISKRPTNLETPTKNGARGRRFDQSKNRDQAANALIWADNQLFERDALFL